MGKTDKNKLGLTLGLFFALIHLVWAVIVLAGIGQQLIDWIMPLHFIDAAYSVSNFSVGSAGLLVVLAFVGGYISGWVLGAIWNKVAK